MIPSRLRSLFSGTIFFLSLTCCLLTTALAEKATRIHAGIYLHDVTKFDQKDGVFDADFELWVKWRGEFDPDTLVIANASQEEREPIGREQDGDWNTAR